MLDCASITRSSQQAGFQTDTVRDPADQPEETSSCYSCVFSRNVKCRHCPETYVTIHDNTVSGDAVTIRRRKTLKTSDDIPGRTVGGLQITCDWGSESKCDDEFAALSQLFGLHKVSGFQSHDGHQGKVYCFSDGNSHRYAIKIIQDGRSHHTDLQDKKSELCGLLLPEHQNIATIYALILHAEKNNTFIAVRNEKDIPDKLDPQYRVKIVINEYVDGSDLLDAISESNATVKADCGPKLAISVAKQIVPVLQYIHQHHLFFQDLKPGNIMMTQSGDIKLVDFGLSRYVPSESDDTPSGRRYSFAGTPFYCAPEIYKEARLPKSEREGYTNKIDLWSLGITLGTLTLGENLDSLCDEYQGSNNVKRPKHASLYEEQKAYTLWYSKLDEQKKRNLLLQELKKKIDPSTYCEAERDHLVNIIIGLTKKGPDKRMLLSEVIEQLNLAAPPNFIDKEAEMI